MIDVFNIPNSNQDISIFYSNGVSNSWQTWQKPRNCQWVWIMAIGGGGGGAGGLGQSTTNGSTAGGAGAVTRAIFNASQLPDTLFIQVGLGGTGGDRSVNGSSGNRSFISILPNTTSTNGVLASGGISAAGGLTTGVAVAGEGVFTTATAVFGSLSTFDSRQGPQSQTGNVTPSTITPLSSQITCPGQQGAAYNTTTPAAINGGSINSTTLSPLIDGGTGTIAASTDGGDGANGITSWKPFFSTGGAGGGNSRFGVGGNGGKGGIGSGGGAGGASGVTGAGGRGGSGGDGLVVIIAF